MKLKFLILAAIAVISISSCGNKDEKSDDKKDEKSGYTDDEKSEFMNNCKNAISGYGDDIAGKICECTMEKAQENKITLDELKNNEKQDEIGEIMMECIKPYEGASTGWNEDVKQEFSNLCITPLTTEHGEEKATLICDCAYGKLSAAFLSPDEMTEDAIKGATLECIEENK